jgi:aryl-alcohol dehydrogenase-like predicted oxidoreductase
VVDAVVEVAEKEALTPAQVAIAWLLARPGVTSPIVGASRPEQLQDSIRALDSSLSEESVSRLDEVSARFR